MIVNYEAQKKNVAYLIDAYAQVLNVLLEHKDDDGTCRISQTEIARRLNVSQTAIARRIANLRKFGAIEKVGHRGGYIVKETDLYKHSPLGLLYDLMLLLQIYPDIVDDYYAQANLLGVTYRDIQVARGYLTFVIT